MFGFQNNLQSNTRLSFLALVLLFCQPSKAEKAINIFDTFELKIQADSVITNRGLGGRDKSENDFESVFEYRIEPQLSLYKYRGHAGKLITRVEGVGIIDEMEDQFLTDGLIDIPELLFEDDFKLANNDAFVTFGRFANRRYFNRNDITSDNFDIGERRFVVIQSNTSNLLNSINEGRTRSPISPNRQATGSFGFSFGLKDNSGNKFTDGWGFLQALAAADFEDIENTLYGISEINKNWKAKMFGQDGLAGKFNFGAAYGSNSAFQLPAPKNFTSLFYASAVQKFHPKLALYTRYATQFFEGDNNEGVNQNEIKAGLTFKFGPKDSMAHHLNYYDSNGYRDKNAFVIVHTYKHKFTNYFSTIVYFVHQYNMPNDAAFTGFDNRWNTGLHLHFVL